MTTNDEVNWDKIAYVVGTKDDLSFSGIRHECVSCGATVYTGRYPYPNDVAVVCEDCAVSTTEEETTETE